MRRPTEKRKRGVGKKTWDGIEPEVSGYRLNVVLFVAHFYKVGLDLITLEKKSFWLSQLHEILGVGWSLMDDEIYKLKSQLGFRF